MPQCWDAKQSVPPKALVGLTMQTREGQSGTVGQELQWHCLQVTLGTDRLDEELNQAQERLLKQVYHVHLVNILDTTQCSVFIYQKRMSDPENEVAAQPFHFSDVR